MTSSRAPVRTAFLSVALVAGGVWLGHMIEHLRAEGLAGIAHELGHTHLYMGPLGLALFGFASLACLSWARLHDAPLQRFTDAHRVVVQPMHGDTLARIPPVTVPSREMRWLTLAAPLAVAQVLGYGLQENVEAMLEAETLPLLGVFAGTHWGAAFVQVGVAGLLSALMFACRRRTEELARSVRVIERLARWLRRAVPILAPPVQRERSFTSMERHGRHLLQRPPPRLLLSR